MAAKRGGRSISKLKPPNPHLCPLLLPCEHTLSMKCQQTRRFWLVPPDSGVQKQAELPQMPLAPACTTWHCAIGMCEAASRHSRLSIAL